MRLPAHRFLNYVQAWCYQRIQPEKREEWEHMLTAPLPGREKEKKHWAADAVVEDDDDGFMAAMAMLS